MVSRAGENKDSFQGFVFFKTSARYQTKSRSFLMGETTVLEREVGLATIPRAAQNVLLPTWVLAHEVFIEQLEVAHENTRTALGHLALVSSVEAPTIAQEVINPATLLATIERAAFEDTQAKATLELNVATDMSERVFKAGNQTSVAVKFEQRKISQNGLNLTDIYQNPLKHTTLNAEMTTRSKAETTNMFLFEELAADGILDTHYAVVFSLAPEDEETIKDYKFFEDTLTCSIQLLDLSDSEGTIKTALVAGKKTPSSPRHDLDVVKEIANQNGLSFAPSAAAESLQYVMLINKTDLPNDIDDIVCQFDDIAGDTFYGEQKPRQDYRAYAQYCQKRNSGFSKQVKEVTQQLIDEAHLLETPLDAVVRLDELSEAVLVAKAVVDTSINPLVFGAKAAVQIEEARYHAWRGNMEQANYHTVNAQKLADSSSCPLKINKDGRVEQDNENESTTSEDCEFISEECPKCHAKKVKTTCKDGIYICGKNGCRSDED